MEELVEAFSLDRIVKAGSRFDPEKARWFNHQYLMQKPDTELAGWFRSELEDRGLEFDQEHIARSLSLIKERAFLLPDLWEQSWFIFKAPESYDEKAIRKSWKEDTKELIREVRELLESLDSFKASDIEPAIKDLVGRKEIGFGKIMNPLRLLLVGSNLGPGLMDLMEVLGKEEVLRRIDKGSDTITASHPRSE
jgi:glutamyl-tRNA synthetase